MAVLKSLISNLFINNAYNLQDLTTEFNDNLLQSFCMFDNGSQLGSTLSKFTSFLLMIVGEHIMSSKIGSRMCS